MNEGEKPGFSAQFILEGDHPDLATLKKAMVEVAKGQWGDKAETVLKQLQGQDRVFLRRGDEKIDGDGNVMDGYAGNRYLTARSYVRPTIVDRDKSPLSENDGKPYSGCYVNAYLAIWAQQHPKYGKRINAQLQGVQFARDGDAFGAGKSASPDVFDSLADEYSDFDDDDLV